MDLEPLARAHGITIRRCADINSAESVQHVRELRPDLMVVTGWTRLLSAGLLRVPPRGVVGFHASLLPRYRGRAPVNWAILRGEAESGNTMMYLDAGTDTGDIIDQQTVPIALDDTCATIYARVGEAGADMLRRGRLHARPASRAAGFTRGRLHARPASRAAGKAGEVLGSDADGVLVGTADGAVLLTSLSDAGDPPGPAATWAAQNGLRAGDRFELVPGETAGWALGLGPEPARDLAR